MPLQLQYCLHLQNQPPFCTVRSHVHLEGCSSRIVLSQAAFYSCLCCETPQTPYSSPPALYCLRRFYCQSDLFVFTFCCQIVMLKIPFQMSPSSFLFLSQGTLKQYIKFCECQKPLFIHSFQYSVFCRNICFYPCLLCNPNIYTRDNFSAFPNMLNDSKIWTEEESGLNFFQFYFLNLLFKLGNLQHSFHSGVPMLLPSYDKSLSSSICL